jgi:hypothetical protein
MASISTAENDNPNFADDDEWKGFESDNEAEPGEREGYEPDNEAEHSVWKGINSETDTPKDSNSHGSGVSPRLRVFSEMKDGTSAELNDKFDPDHHLSILSNLIRRTEKPPDFVNGLRYQYARIVKNFGVKAVEEQILGSLEKDLRHLIGTRRLDFETVKSCNKSKAQSCVRPGVYIHVIYDPADSDYIGVYIGSALYIGPRIGMHIRDFKAARNRKKKGKKKRRRNTLHIDFWSRRPGIRDFWLVFGQLKTRDDNDKEELAFLLNILEMYAMLLFRTLPLQILRGNLPKGSKTNPYLWTGLNVADLIKQYREGLGSSITRKQHYFNLRPPAFRNISYRDANPSKGDKLRVELMCYRCRNPQSYFVDQYPRYEIASGKWPAHRVLAMG